MDKKPFHLERDIDNILLCVSGLLSFSIPFCLDRYLCNPLHNYSLLLNPRALPPPTEEHTLKQVYASNRPFCTSLTVASVDLT